MPILTAEERVGSVLAGKYRLQAVLAHGGMGVLFRAEHTWTGRQVAVKMLRARELTPNEASDGKRLDRFVLEARAATQVAHPNVVDVLDMGAAEDGTPFLAMELLEGESLSARLERARSLPIDEALQTLLPIMGALALAHDRAIVHRDLKPANVFLATDTLGRVTPKLLDFGIAKVASQTTLTDPGAAIGTPEAMSPEQATGQSEIGPATDIWAMGVVLYRCLAGVAPFRADTTARVLLQIVNERHSALGKLAPHVPLALCAAIERALEKRPEQRYPSMRAFAQALTVAADGAGLGLPTAPDPIGLPDYPYWRSQAAQTGTGDVQPVAVATPSTPPAARAPDHRARSRAWLLGAVLCAALAGAAWALRSGDSAEPLEPVAAAAPPASVEPVLAPAPAPLPAMALPNVAAAAAPAADPPDAGPVRAMSEPEPAPAAQRKRRKPREAPPPPEAQPAPASEGNAVPALKPTW